MITSLPIFFTVFQGTTISRRSDQRLKKFERLGMMMDSISPHSGLPLLKWSLSYASLCPQEGKYASTGSRAGAPALH